MCCGVVCVRMRARVRARSCVRVVCVSVRVRGVSVVARCGWGVYECVRVKVCCCCVLLLFGGWV